MEIGLILIVRHFVFLWLFFVWFEVTWDILLIIIQKYAQRSMRPNDLVFFFVLNLCQPYATWGKFIF